MRPPYLRHARAWLNDLAALLSCLRPPKLLAAALDRIEGQP